MNRITYGFILISAGLSVLAAQQPSAKATEMSTGEAVLSVCSLLENGQWIEGRTVTIQADVIGSQHALVLQGKACGEGIYLVHKWGQKGKTWESFDEALVRESSGLDPRVLLVTVRGVLSGGDVRGASSHRQIKVTKVLSVLLTDRKLP
jgi:hypothetical protein